MKKIYPILLILFCAILSGCDNELTINAEYEEKMVVYGLLDFSQPEQFIKINKAYLSTQNSAYVDAQIADSLYLDSVHAKLVDNFGNEIVLTRTNIANKEDGVFTNEVNTFYTTNQPLNPNNSYTIVVTNPINNNIVSAQTNLVQNAFFRFPFVNNSSKWILNPNGKTRFEFTPGKNGILYDLKVRFNYQEINKADTNIKTDKFVDWFIFKDRVLDNALGNANVTQVIESSLFYEFLNVSIQEDTSVNRRAIDAGLYIYGGGTEINNYISVSKPSIGIVQKQSDYSNVNNGIGIFSSRNVRSITGIQFNPITISYLKSDSRTQNLNFID